MPQVVELPTVGQDVRGGLVALARLCKEMPAKEPFRDLRTRLRNAKLWDRAQPLVMLRFLGVSGATVTPSPTVQALAAATNDDALFDVVLDRMWQLNPLLMKTIIELVTQRTYHKDEISKFLASVGYRGVVPARPALENWLQLAITAGLLKTLGIAVSPGPRAARFATQVAEFDVDQFLEEDKPMPDPVMPGGDDEAPAGGAVEAVGDSGGSIPVTAAAPIGAPLPPALRGLAAEGLPSPRTRDRSIASSRFASGFSDELLGETSERIAAWWAEVAPNTQTSSYQPSDFSIEHEAWVEGADEVVYRIAVAAALAFRLDRDRAGVIAAFRALDQLGVLGDLYQGTVPEQLPSAVDARALMLASLAARRCAEVPELAASLEGRASAGEAFAALDTALGRGLFRSELFWMMDMLGKLGVIRYDDLGDYSVTPHRIVRDTLFRLGFTASPYAADSATLASAAKAARKAVPSGPADEVLALFTLAAGCAYDCAHRKACHLACRERLE